MTKTVKIIVITLAIIVGLLYVTDNQYILSGLSKTYLKGNTTANINDHDDFDNNVILAGSPQAWPLADNYNKLKLTDSLKLELEKFHTAAFLIIKDGKLVHEQYWDGYKEDTKTNSFSMAKSIVTMLLGAAIQDGYIKGLDQPITDFLPEYKNDSLAKKATIGNLSAMTAGFDWKESYTLPLNPTAKAYYGDDMDEVILNRKFNKESGKSFEYLSGDTQLLTYILKRATKKTLAAYLTEKLWQPMGMEKDALWTLDHKGGIEKGYCCVHSNAKDFAKLGQLLLQKGNWNGKQLLDSAFVQKMITPNIDPRYGYSIWTDYSHNPKLYMMRGHLGQFVICIPEKNIIIVRLGEQMHHQMKPNHLLETFDVYTYVHQVLKMVN